MNLPKKLQDKLNKREENQSLRSLPTNKKLIDFSSNDYLGLSNSKEIFLKADEYLIEKKLTQNGATGSRLISGNHSLYEETERFLCNFHQSEAALIFNSGYDANIGFFSCVPQRGDVILYDEFAHASIRDGIRLSNAKSYKFKHNDIDDLKYHLERSKEVSGVTYIVTESVFSMDGDSPDLEKMVSISNQYKALLIVDEAHAVGVLGDKGTGLIQKLKLESQIFARIVTFGKALGCHGAAILGNNDLKNYLINFARSFIYTTGLPPHSLATILSAYDFLSISSKGVENLLKLNQNIQFFKQELARLGVKEMFIDSNSSIHSCVISGNKEVKSIAQKLQESGFDVKPIVSPTVPENQERIRFCLHSYNSQEEITNVLETLCIFVAKPF